MTRIFIFIGALIFSVQTFAQVRTAVATFDNTAFDFGTIKEADGKVHHKFEFTNTGATPLIITNVEASCGCTTPEWTKAPIMPKQKGYVDAEFDPANYQKFDKSITVSTNGQPATITLRILGEVVPKEKLMTDIFAYNFGSARVKGKNVAFPTLSTQAADLSFEFYNDTNKEVNLSVLNLPNYVSVDKASLKIAPKQIAVLKFTADPTKTTSGFHKDLVTLKVDNVKYDEALKIVASVK
jgi:hypothetical protein